MVRSWCNLYTLTSKYVSRHNDVYFFNIRASKSGANMCGGVLNIFIWKCVWSYNDVQFFMSHLASWLRTRRFSKPIFRPRRFRNPKLLEKHRILFFFLTFLYIFMFFLLIFSFLFFFLLIFFFSLPFPCSAFYLFILSEI